MTFLILDFQSPLSPSMVHPTIDNGGYSGEPNFLNQPCGNLGTCLWGEITHSKCSPLKLKEAIVCGGNALILIMPVSGLDEATPSFTSVASNIGGVCLSPFRSFLDQIHLQVIMLPPMTINRRLSSLLFSSSELAEPAFTKDPSRITGTPKEVKLYKRWNRIWILASS